MSDQLTNQKLMVNWTTRKIVSISEHRGSNAFKKLVAKGYEEVATVKQGTPLFINDAFFEIEAKYDRGPDTITT